MNAAILLRAIESEQRNKEIETGFKAIIRAYFNEYTDATEIDAQFYSALETIFDLCFPCGTDSEKELDDLIEEVTG